MAGRSRCSVSCCPMTRSSSRGPRRGDAHPSSDRHRDEQPHAVRPLGRRARHQPGDLPFLQVIRRLPPVVVGGDVLLLKSASTTMDAGETIAAVAKEAGLPHGVVHTLRIEPDMIGDIIADDRVHGASSTVSTRGGRGVVSIAGAHGRRSVLGLGGSEPCVVLDDAHVGRAARMVVASRSVAGGQRCVAAKRFVVQRSVAAGEWVVVPEGSQDGPRLLTIPSLLTGVEHDHAMGNDGPSVRWPRSSWPTTRSQRCGSRTIRISASKVRCGPRISSVASDSSSDVMQARSRSTTW